MAYDGIVVAATVSELNHKLLGGSIQKVAQPEKDELLFTVKVDREPVRLYMSANPSLPMVCLKEEGTLSMVNAPSFCMSLRKHIGGGRILKIEQAPDLERIIIFTIEHLDEMGDRGIKKLICELMGKHSNIILTKPDDTIIDSIRHVTFSTSSLREVLPGRTYFLPETSHHGLGKVMDRELVIRAGIDPEKLPASYTTDEVFRLNKEREKLETAVRQEQFRPNMIFENDRAAEYSAVSMLSFTGGQYTSIEYESISRLVCDYYEKKEVQNRINSKSEDIRLILKNLTERCAKKLDIQEKQYADAMDREKYRIYGELLNVYGYGLKGGEKSLNCENFYDENKVITIPLDPQKSWSENAKRYFERYQKMKRTAQALEGQIRENRNMLYHLDSIRNALSLSRNEADLREIRQEMAEAGYIKKTAEQKGGKVRKEEQRSKPLHFVSSDGFDIYVGRNNAQNEELDFKMASPSDWWFHAKKIPGSHVIVKTGKNELPDQTCMEAASLAAYYSQAAKTDPDAPVEVDYVQREHLKKVPGAPKGFVIYHTNYSMLAHPREKL